MVRGRIRPLSTILIMEKTKFLTFDSNSTSGFYESDVLKSFLQCTSFD